ncbi:AtpZ/AtpI family protein [Methylomonas paludis]|uniref:AtpZ/AtpI family protein n=1 Tax=Methylomonas paludis TaxID=1173101 RepID=A0A975MKD4_9GAMM|nr:AtpZ/AtpI family protein [Methylomonas paludis]QWF69415.1 AtpZ/AtpI family protein [Methylomonas paludis]
MSNKAAKPPVKPDNLADQIGTKVVRKLKARRHGTPGIWFGMGMMGLIGWSVATPTLLGVALGMWLDKHFPGKHPWTLALLMAGLVLGCVNAWMWVAKEDKAMHQQDEEDNDE